MKKIIALFFIISIILMLTGCNKTDNWAEEELPSDIVETIDYTINRRINEEMQEFSFNIKGINTKKYNLNYDKQSYYEIQEIEISSIIVTSKDNTFIQELNFEKTFLNMDVEDIYGFSLDDWNFDGYLDISLWQNSGGSMLNQPHYYWLWDKEKGKFIENDYLEELSQIATLSIDEENEQIMSSTRINSLEYHIGHHKIQEFGEYLLVKSDEHTIHETDDSKEKIVHHTIRELINGEMIITEEYDKTVNTKKQNLLDPYYKLIEEHPNYKIYTDKSGEIYFYNVYDNSGECIDRGFHVREVRFEMNNEILSIRMGFGTYTFSCRYYNVNTSQVSRFYDTQLEVSGNYIAYFMNRNNDIVLIVQDIFDKSVYYKEIKRDFSPDVLKAYSKTEFINDNKQLKINYPTSHNNKLITEVIDL